MQEGLRLSLEHSSDDNTQDEPVAFEALGVLLAVSLASHSLLLTARTTVVTPVSLTTFFGLAFSFFSQALVHAVPAMYWVDGVSPKFISFPEPQM